MPTLLPQQECLHPSKRIVMDTTDDADGADGIFSARARPDHSGSCSTFTRKRDLDAQRPEDRLRPPQSTGERARVFCPSA
jgi:hypothetical protein